MSDRGAGDAAGDVTELLAACTEAGRLARAGKLVDKVDLMLDEGDLIVGAVANYNVVVDVAARCVHHGCRDFHGQASRMHLCKHVAATILSLAPEIGGRIAAELAASTAAAAAGEVPRWRFEVITRFVPRG